MIIFSLLGMLVKIILMLLLVIIVILLLILIIPFNYRISALLKEKVNFYLHVHWAFFKVELLLTDMKLFVKVRLFGRTIINEPIKKRTEQKPAKKSRKSDFKMPSRAFFREMLNFSKEVLDVFKPKEITAFGCYGLDDPVNTAMVSFILQLFCELMPQANIGLEPVFDSEITDIEINISGKIRLVVLVYILIKYLLKRDVRQVVFRKRIKAET